MDSWISSLAKQSAADSQVASKSERIQKRKAKRARREERAQRKQSQNTSQHQQQHEHDDEHDDDGDGGAADDGTSHRNGNASSQNSSMHHRVPNQLNQHRLDVLATTLRNMKRAHRNGPKFCASKAKRKRKAKGWTKELVQPPKKSYGGIGLARKSLFLGFDNAAFFPLLEEEFLEHIPGFYGRQKTKAMKKQLDSHMLWRKLQKEKEDGGSAVSKRLARLSPDERVEEMIRLGML